MSNVALPDGSTHYFGDIRMNVQTLDQGTLRLEVSQGQVIIKPMPQG